MAPLSRILRCAVAATVWTDPPESDLSLVDEVTAVVDRVEAWRRADHAINVGRRSAAAADDVMVVVADTKLIKPGTSGRPDPPDETGSNEGVQHVVDGLRRDFSQARTGCREDCLRVRMGWRLCKCRQNGDALGRRLQSGASELPRDIKTCVVNACRMPHGLE